MKKYVVYCHTNKINGKKYIGITSMKPEKRWANGLGYRGNPYFNSAIEKYGWDSFSHDIWYTDLTCEEANALEAKLIKKYDSANREHGYNIDLGGNSIGKVSEETKRKQSESQKGEKSYWWGKKGNLNPMFGKHHSEEWKAKAREISSKYTHSDEMKEKMSYSHPRNRAVKCVQTGVVYRSAAEAARKCGLNPRHIGDACRGKLYSSGGFEWKFAEELV